MHRSALAVLLVGLVALAGCSALVGTDADYDHRLWAVNEADETRTGQLEVLDNETGEVVFSESVTLDPGERREVFDFESVSDSGTTEFLVRIDPTNGTRTATTVSMTTAGFGDVSATFVSGDARIVVEA